MELPDFSHPQNQTPHPQNQALHPQNQARHPQNQAPANVSDFGDEVPDFGDGPKTAPGLGHRKNTREVIVGGFKWPTGCTRLTI